MLEPSIFCAGMLLLQRVLNHLSPVVQHYQDNDSRLHPILSKTLRINVASKHRRSPAFSVEVNTDLYTNSRAIKNVLVGQDQDTTR